jgi:hypothetical protein
MGRLRLQQSVDHHRRYDFGDERIFADAGTVKASVTFMQFCGAGRLGEFITNFLLENVPCEPFVVQLLPPVRSLASG